LTKRLSELPALSFAKITDKTSVIDAIATLELITGQDVPPSRAAVIAKTLVEHGFTEAMLVEAVERMKTDLDFNRKITYKSPITAADFIQVLHGDSKSFSRLYSRTEMLDHLNKYGRGSFIPVQLRKEDPIMFRLKD
tara:strand:+ start:15308 stop:15718 length:411 start_codon:yes stop_codon:yes gene_type:complete